MKVTSEQISAMYSPDEKETKKGVDASLDSPDPKKILENAKKLLSKEAAEIRDLDMDTTRVQIIKKVSVMSARELGMIMETIEAMEPLALAENERLKRELKRAGAQQGEGVEED